MLTHRPALDNRPPGGWCVGFGVDRPPHWVESGELIRTPPTTGVPLCAVCHRKHRDSTEGRDRDR